jgi:putative addiction module CopG family antidote
MKIELRPELEALIAQNVQRGSYKSVDEFVEKAVTMLHEQEAWLAEQSGEIRAKIEEGHAAAQRSELVEAAEVRVRVEEKKRAWPSEKR